MSPSTDAHHETFADLSEVAHATNSELEAELLALRDLARNLQEQNTELAKDRDLADRECRRLRKEADALRQQLMEAREQDPKSETIRGILEHWKQQTGHQRALVPITGKRADSVRRALKWGAKPAKIRLAIDGAARYPFVVDAKRCATGPKHCRYDDLETILKSERQIERLADLAAVEPEAEPVARSVRPLEPKLEPVGIDEFLGLLDGVKPGGLNQWTARCPAHEDSHASLSVGLGRVGVVAHCHAGCQIEDIARAVGVDVSRLFDRVAPAPAPARRAAPKATATIEPLEMEADVGRWRDRLLAHHGLLARLAELRGWHAGTLEALGVGFDGERLTLPVRDQHGALVNVLRYLPARRDGERKLLAMKGRPRDLFPTPETLDGGELWLLEGEPDAITGRQIGLRATGLPGVNGWRDAWARRFDGARVIVCLDCDEQGRAAAQRVASSLATLAREVRIVDLDPTRTDGFDVSDYVQAGGDAQGLLRLAMRAASVVRLGEMAA